MSNVQGLFTRCDAVADLGFPRELAPIPEGGANLIFGIIVAENCMKMKEIGPNVPTLGSANAKVICQF